MLVVIIIIIIMVVVHHYCHGGGDHHHYHQWWSSLLSWWWWSLLSIWWWSWSWWWLGWPFQQAIILTRLFFFIGQLNAPFHSVVSSKFDWSTFSIMMITIINISSSSSWSPKNCSMLSLSPPSPAPPPLPKSPKQRHRGGRTLESAMFSKLIFMKYHLCWNSPGQKAGVFALPRFNNDNTSSRRGCWLRRSTCWFHTFATKYTYLLNQDWPGRLILNYNELVLGSAICFKLLYFLFHFHFLTNAIKHCRGLLVY